MYAGAVAAFKIDDPTPTYCRDIDYTLEDGQPFLTLDKEFKKLVLAPKLEDSTGDYKAHLHFFFVNFP